MFEYKTFEERKRIYEEAYTFLLFLYQSKDYQATLCYALTSYAVGYSTIPASDDIERYFREVWGYRPDSMQGYYWFSLDKNGLRKRIEVLEKAIEFCNLKTKNNES